MDTDPLPRRCNIITKGFVFVLIGSLLFLSCLHNNGIFNSVSVDFSKSIKLIKYSKAPRSIFYGASTISPSFISEGSLLAIAQGYLSNANNLYNVYVKRLVSVPWYNSKYF